MQLMNLLVSADLLRVDMLDRSSLLCVLQSVLTSGPVYQLSAGIEWDASAVLCLAELV